MRTNQDKSYPTTAMNSSGSESVTGEEVLSSFLKDSIMTDNNHDVDVEQMNDISSDFYQDLINIDNSSSMVDYSKIFGDERMSTDETVGSHFRGNSSLVNDHSFTDHLNAIPTSSNTSSNAGSKTGITNIEPVPSSDLYFVDVKDEFPDNLSSETATQDLLNNIKFGRIHNDESPQINMRPPIENKQELDKILSTSPDDTKYDYKYKLYLADLPTKSRVETQIRCRLVLSPPPDELLLKLPADTIARPKFQVLGDLDPSPNILQLDVQVVSQKNPDVPIYMCSKCTSREQKRAFRKKNLDEYEEYYWKQDRLRGLVIFNCKEVLPFTSGTTSCNIGKRVVSGRSIELPMRLACYSRHHDSKTGFRVIFTLRDHTNTIVAQAASSPIVITDDHKIASSSSQAASEDISSAGQVSLWRTELPSPDSSSEAFTSDNYSEHSLKRRRGSDWTRNESFVSSNGLSVFNSRSPPQSQPQRPLNRIDLPSPQSSDNQPVKTLPLMSVASPHNNVNTAVPRLERVIPAQGSIRGGIDVTLLGSGFQKGLTAVFGENRSASTQCWSDTTIVTHLPAALTPGPVIVSFEGFVLTNPQIFTYYDDTDRQLIELALQVVGLKMNGRLEDARNIAMRIVGDTSHEGSKDSTAQSSTAGTSNSSLEVQDDHEAIILRCIELVYVNNAGHLANWQLKNTEGQTMIHLASALGYTKVVMALLSRGARVDSQDVNGMTPLHFAALHGHRNIIQILIRCHADPTLKTHGGISVSDMAGETISDLLGDLSDNFRDSAPSRPSGSSSTLSSIFSIANGYLHNDFNEESGGSGAGNLDRALSSVSLQSQFNMAEDEWDSGDDWAFDYEDSSDEEDERLEVKNHHRVMLREQGVLGSDDFKLVAHYERCRRKDEPKDSSTVDSDSTTEKPADREQSNLSKYLAKFSTSARNKMHWDAHWDEIVQAYPFLRGLSRPYEHPTQLTDSDRMRTVGYNGSDSDATIGTAPRQQSNKMNRMWKYFVPPKTAMIGTAGSEILATANKPEDESSQSQSSSPPRYDEIFPDSGESATVPGEEKPQTLDPLYETPQENEEKYIQAWTQKRKKLQNDRMLFMFWLPVLLLAITYITLKWLKLLPEYTTLIDTTGRQVREWLGYKLLGRKLTVPSDNVISTELTVITTAEQRFIAVDS